jgi:hypothetical protein
LNTSNECDYLREKKGGNEGMIDIEKGKETEEKSNE